MTPTQSGQIFADFCEKVAGLENEPRRCRVCERLLRPNEIGLCKGCKDDETED